MTARGRPVSGNGPSTAVNLDFMAVTARLCVAGCLHSKHSGATGRAAFKLHNAQTAGRSHGHRSYACASLRRDDPLQVLVRDNNVDQALRVLKKKMQREGVFREMKQRRAYEKPSERKNREKSEAIRRARKLARKKAQREGLIAPPKKKPMDDKRGGRPGMTGGERGGMGGARPPRF